MQQIFASIITIGDELLIGQVIDTNSAFIAQQLNSIGISIKHRMAVGDVWDDIWQALDEEAKHAQIVLITGGLGPTADDITKPLLNKYFGGKMVVDAGALENVTNIFTKLGRPMIDRNLKQAEVPDVCTVIQNSRGTAPGMWFEKDGVIFISMPGVPHEMKGMMTDYILHQLQHRFTLPTIIHKTLLAAGVGESFLADLIQEWEEKLPKNIKLAYLPNFGMVRLRLSAIGPDRQTLENATLIEFRKLQTLVHAYLVTNEDEPIQEVIAKLLLEKKQTMTTAESCTGGYIAHLITSIPGSSIWYNGSVVAYAYAAKEDFLGVSHETLITKGAVSEEVVLQMAEGARIRMKADYAIATSGIMGPGGGMTEKPVGTVWMAISSKDKTVAKKFYFRFDRQRNIELAATYALNFLRQFILEG